MHCTVTTCRIANNHKAAEMMNIPLHSSVLSIKDKIPQHLLSIPPDLARNMQSARNTPTSTTTAANAIFSDGRPEIPASDHVPSGRNSQGLGSSYRSRLRDNDLLFRLPRRRAIRLYHQTCKHDWPSLWLLPRTGGPGAAHSDLVCETFFCHGRLVFDMPG